MYTTKLALALFLAAAPALHAQTAPQGAGPFNGSWQFNLSIVGNDATDTCSLTSDGKTIKGSCGTLGTLLGTIDGANVEIKADGGQSPVVFTGKLQDGTVKGTVDVPAYAVQGDFTAKPVK